VPRITFAEMCKREAIVQKNVKPTIAVVAVHGVNAREPFETARAAARMLLNLRNESIY
jgi:hypothetical protein